MTERSPQWDVPGWDWEPGDYAWLSSESGIYDHDTRTSVFFIHGGRIRHQSSIPPGEYTREQFDALFQRLSDGLDDPYLVWSTDTGGGDSGLWIEGTRPPNESDLARLRAARERAALEERGQLHAMRQRHPEWFTDVAPRWNGQSWDNWPPGAGDSRD